MGIFRQNVSFSKVLVVWVKVQALVVQGAIRIMIGSLKD